MRHSLLFFVDQDGAQLSRHFDISDWRPKKRFFFLTFQGLPKKPCFLLNTDFDPLKSILLPPCRKNIREAYTGSRWLPSRSQISDLRSQISDLGSQISDLRSQISDLRSQISDLRRRSMSLQPLRKTFESPPNSSGGTKFFRRQTSKKTTKNDEKQNFVWR